MNRFKSAAIIGFGSIGKRHAKILEDLKVFKEIFIVSKQNIKTKYKKLSSIKDLKNLKPDYFIICSDTHSHLKDLKYLDKNFNNKIILVEKPLFNRFSKFSPKNNKVYVSYNFRFHPVINFIKKFCDKKKVIYVYSFCGSYLPDWRKNINYKKSYSASNKRGGGVLLDLSHEFDYIIWIFGELKINSVFHKRISNLEINSKDILSFSGFSKKSKFVQINLNYISKIPKRFIYIEGNNFSIEGDLIRNIILLKSSKNQKMIKFSSKSLEKSYITTHKKILSSSTGDLCDFKQGIMLNKLFDQINQKK